MTPSPKWVRTGKLVHGEGTFDRFLCTDLLQAKKLQAALNSQDIKNSLLSKRISELENLLSDSADHHTAALSVAASVSLFSDHLPSCPARAGSKGSPCNCGKDAVIALFVEFLYISGRAFEVT